MVRVYPQAITARRAFSMPGYTTYAEARFDGDYVCPIHVTSGNLTGPMFVSKDWLDGPSARAEAEVLHRLGYLPDAPFNRVMDLVLDDLGLTRGDIYITRVFKLLPDRRSAPLSAADARASWRAVTRHELLGRLPVALGSDAAGVLRHFGVPHVPAPHPSARIGTYTERARRIARAARLACQHVGAGAGSNRAGSPPAKPQELTHVL